MLLIVLFLSHALELSMMTGSPPIWSPSTCAGHYQVHGPEDGDSPARARAREGKLEVRSHCMPPTRANFYFFSVTPNNVPATSAHKLLAVALERALQRRIGDVPSPTLVNEAISKLVPSGANPSPFVQHAVRVQEQLARLHAQIQIAQGPQDRPIASIQDTPTTMPLTRAQKRFAACDDDDDFPVQETKRKRLDSAGSARPRPNTPPSTSTSDNEVDPDTKASMTTDIRSDPKHAEQPDPRADSVGLMDTNSPTGIPIAATGTSTSGETRQRSHSDDTHRGYITSQVAQPQPDHPSSAQMHTKDKLGIGTVSSPSTTTATIHDDAQGPPLPT